MSGFSKPRLERVRDLLAGAVERGDLPAAVALLARDGVCSRAQAGTAAGS